MTDIACPTCQKKYRLGEKFPATFTCKACGTAMDLSSFPGAVAAAAAAPPAPPVVHAGAGTPAPHRSRGGASARARVRAAGRRHHGARRDDDEEEGGRGGRGAPRRRGVSPALLWGSIAGVVVVAGLAVFLLTRKKDGADDPTTTAAAGAAGTTAPGTTSPGAGAATPAGGETTTEAPAAAPVEAPPAGPKYYAANRAEIKPKEHHPEASPEERQKIDALVETAVFENAGRDSKDAEEELVKIGLKAAPRVVNVFHRVKTHPSENFDNRLGMMKAAIADRILRRVDGVIERKFPKSLTALHAASDAKHAEKIAKVWNWWWDVEEWKKGHKPWDDRVEGKWEDSEEAPPEGAKPPSAPKPPGEPSRAGGNTPDG